MVKKQTKAAFAIGIDLGGSKIAGSLIDRQGKVLAKFVRPTNADHSRAEILENILEVINLLRRKGKIAGVGIGIPGFCDTSGRIAYIPNVAPLKGVNLKKMVESRSGFKTIVQNDAKCFTLAEARLGAAKGKNNVIGVVIGTGVGSGIMIDGKVYSGKQGGAGEIGHTKMYVKSGKKIKLFQTEDLVSGTAFLRRYSKLASRKVERIPEISRSSRNYKKIYGEFVNNLSICFANLINTLNPEVIVVGGGLSNLNFYKPVQKKARSLAIPELARHCQVKKNKLGPDSGAIGAGLLAFEEFSR